MCAILPREGPFAKHRFTISLARWLVPGRVVAGARFRVENVPPADTCLLGAKLAEKPKVWFGALK